MDKDNWNMLDYNKTGKKEDVYAEKGLDNPSLSDAELLDIMVKNPILIERPIVLANGKAALGRPPEQVLNILE